MTLHVNYAGDPVLGIFALVALVAIVVILSTIGLIIWIARGESDVNGDPERDAGYTEEEIAARLGPPALSRSERELIAIHNEPEIQKP